MATLFRIVILAFSFTLQALGQSAWKMGPWEDGHEYRRPVTCVGVLGAFETEAIFQMSPKTASLSITIPNFKKFKMLDLQPLIAVDGPMPGRRALTLTHPTLKTPFKLDIQGVISEPDDSGENTYQLPWVGNREPSDKTCTGLISAIQSQPNGWKAVIAFKGKRISFDLDFPNI